VTLSSQNTPPLRETRATLAHGTGRETNERDKDNFCRQSTIARCGPDKWVGYIRKKTADERRHDENGGPGQRRRPRPRLLSPQLRRA